MFCYAGVGCVTRSTAEVAAATERTKTLGADVERYMTQWRQAKALYEEEVMKHAENIKKMQVRRFISETRPPPQENPTSRG